MTLEIVTDPERMVIRVGPKEFHEPYLWKVPEWGYDIKQEIAPHPAIHTLGPKERNKFFCDNLGPKFNIRFLAANYHMWLGDRFEKVTRDMLRIGGNTGWKVYSKDLVIKANRVHEHVIQAEEDGLHHLIPAIVIFEKHPSEIRKLVGPSTWRRIASNSRTRNMKLMQRSMWIACKEPSEQFLELLEFPSGVLLGVHSTDPEYAIAARICPRKTRASFEATMHTVRDTMRMLGADFNPKWSLNRINQEHNKAITAQRTKTYSAKAFCADWNFSGEGLSADLLTSPLAIAVEGGTQHHCVGSYWRESRDGKYAVMKITGNERATAGLYRRDQVWVVDQVYGACNAIVSQKCMDFAHKIATHFPGYSK